MKILIATGGSGGHIFPAVNVAKVLQSMGHEIMLAGVFPPSTSSLLEGFRVYQLSAVGLSLKNFGKFFHSCSRMWRSLGESRRAIRQFQPQVVCGFGGYGAFSVVLMATFYKIPSMIHEQNVVPGRANQILAKLVAKVAISFKESEKFFPGSKTVLTGSPCHAQVRPESKAELLELFGLDPQKFTFLVVGGSQGSHRINRVFLELAPKLKDILAFQVIHLCGKEDVTKMVQGYQAAGTKARVFEFLKEIGTAYQAADLVVARAGSGTIMDIAQFHRPSVLIPYPHAGGHQKENAAVLTATGTARIIEESDLSSDSLRREIMQLLDLKLSDREIAGRVKHVVFQDASNRLAKQILQLGDR